MKKYKNNQQKPDIMDKYEGSVDSAIETLVRLRYQNEALHERGMRDNRLLENIAEHESFVNEYYKSLEE